MLGAMLSVAFAAFSLQSCQKFNGSQTVPSYIRIDSISLSCDYSIYGANTSNFSDAWVYVDDQILGCFELPSTFPVLRKGNHKVTISPGIKIDGRRGARSNYLFCRPMEVRTMLGEDSVTVLNPVVNYYEEGEILKFGWYEDFEMGASLVPLPDSDTSLVRVSGQEAWRSENSFYSGQVALPADSLDFYLVSAQEMTFHETFHDQTPCMLEMDYKCNDTFFVGLVYKKYNTIVRWPMVKVLPTDKEHAVPEVWNKIYINIGARMKNENASYYQLYFTSDLSVDDQYGEHPYSPLNEPRYYYFDNLKVIYR